MNYSLPRQKDIWRSDSNLSKQGEKNEKRTQHTGYNTLYAVFF